MTVKQVLKKYEDILTITDCTKIKIIDIPNHWELTIDIWLKPESLNKYFKKLLRRKVEDIYWEEKILTLKIY